MTTLATLLYPDAPTGQTGLEEELRRHPGLASVLKWPAVLALIAKDILAFLDMPIGNIAVSAYQKHRRIEEAKRETAESLGARQVVQLMGHKIESNLEPKVEIETGGVTRTILRLEVATELTVESVTAIVESGQLVDVAPGSATAKLTLSADGVELGRAETQPIDLMVPEEARVVIDVTAMGEAVVHQESAQEAAG